MQEVKWCCCPLLVPRYDHGKKKYFVTCSLSLPRFCLHFQYFRVDALTYIHKIFTVKVAEAIEKNQPSTLANSEDRNKKELLSISPEVCLLEISGKTSQVPSLGMPTPDIGAVKRRYSVSCLSPMHSNKRNPQNILPGSAKIIFLTPSISRVAKVVGRLWKRKAI